MADDFEKYLLEKGDFGKEDLELILSRCIRKKIRKRHFLLEEGEICRYRTFVLNGCLRSYSTDEQGTEHILKFAPENWWISDMKSFSQLTPATVSIDAIEDSEILQMTKESFDLLVETIPAFRLFIDELLARNNDAIENRILANISYSAEEKYRHFIQLYPDLARRIPLHMIASYLGVSRERLSHIRNHSK